jgi:hypothetical protein
MSSWTSYPDVFVKRFNPETHTSDYTIDTEPHEPGGPYEFPTPLAPAGTGVGPAPPPPVPAPVAEIAATQVEATNCISCHTDEETLRALAVEEEEEKTSEESTGEG